MPCGCVSDDRNVGPWEVVRDNPWRAPVWIRRGPPGFRTFYGLNEVAYVSLVGWNVTDPSGMMEDTGHLWGDRTYDEKGRMELERAKKWMDHTLKEWGWIVDGEVRKPLTRWQKVKRWFGA